MKQIFRPKKLFPVAAGFLLAPHFFVYAQDSQQVGKIRASSDLRQLNILKKGISKSTMSVKELQSKAKALDIPFSGELDGKYYQLKGFTKKGQPLYYVTYNSDAAKGTGTNKLNPESGFFNLEGEGMQVYEWDGGAVRVGHQEFGGRVTQRDTPSGYSDHATHVAGTMVASGVNALAKGMAPKALLNAYDWTDDESEMISAALEGALLSNHSYGYVGGYAWGNWSGKAGWHWMGNDEDTEYKGYGVYSPYDQSWDLVALNAPYYLPVKAAGNPRGGGPEPGGLHYVNSGGKWIESKKIRQKNGGVYGFDCIIFGATAKNILAVGAAGKLPNGYRRASDVEMGSFSAFGPTDDGRIKPDISGVGVGLYSALTGSDNAYGSMSGTSMASPNVTGSLVLLQEHYSKLNNKKMMKAATLKALVIATANEAGAASGPDYSSGWGLLNAFEAAKTISSEGKYSLIQEEVLSNGQEKRYEVTASGKSPLKVTIAWTDPAPEKVTDWNILNDRTKMLVNDLDVRVFKGGEEFFPWKLNPASPASPAAKVDNDVDNVEQVLIESPEAGAVYTIVVKHKGELKKNTVTTDADGNVQVGLVPASEQAYSMVVTGINHGVNVDLSVEKVEIKAGVADYTESTPVEITVVNQGKEQVDGAKVVYKLINKDEAGKVEFMGELPVSKIEAGQSEVVKATVNLSKSFINYGVLAEVVYDRDEVEANNKAGAEAYGVVANLYPDQASHEFGFEADLIKNGWTTEDADKNGSTWLRYDEAVLARTGNSFALNFPYNKMNINDWLFSNPLKLKANVKYRVVFHARKFEKITETLGVYLGNLAKSTAMSKVIAPSITADADGQYHRYAYEFTVDTDQVAYLGFNHKVTGKNLAYAFAIDDVRVEYAVTKPDPSFKASKLRINSYEVIDLINETDAPEAYPVTSWEWSFTPSTVTFKEGDATAKSPKVTFDKNGKYSITLKAVNVLGERSYTRTNYVDVLNVPTVADFRTSTPKIYEGEAVVFTNSSSGYPAPTAFSWEVTPSDGVEFLSPEGSLARNPNVRFGKPGKYQVALTAKSVHNEHTETKANYIEVVSYHPEVKNLKGYFDEVSRKNQLVWERPSMNPTYAEGFEANGSIPGDITTVDHNSDGYRWLLTGYEKNSGQYAMMSYSYPYGTRGVDVDDWLITPRLRKGAEVLKFAYKNDYPERFDVYVVEAPADGSVPTVEQIRMGAKVYTNELKGAQPRFATVSNNVKELVADKDFFVAFHHRTTKADMGFALYLDDIELGYENKESKKTTSLVNEEVKDSSEVLLKSAERLAHAVSDVEKSMTTAEPSPINFGITSYPRLVGYEVFRDGQLLGSISDYNSLSYRDGVTENGRFVYDVYAVYSDGLKSDKKTVEIDITTLSSSDLASSGVLKVYPNPSNGHFTVELPSSVSALKAGVYDMSGRQILSKSYDGHKFDLDLTPYAKGVYLLNLVDNQGGKYTVKLIVR
ncbi:T9SS-dependent choice-of-anchor J family protein [Bergeyella sp. RCAD1439]|uniref:T9SS-dependent choice-of-anchor J family protein n=1 Tax=Bergeyella anatis TaxID=3113737 RepID=UPI002E192BE0|nr:choice-of-anchor J domain-containing protein [Bergeyella sp. RCAD1439]